MGDTEWANMFYMLTGADPNHVDVQVRVDGENGLCTSKSAGGKALVSGFTTIITSSSVPAASLGSKLVASVGGTTGATLGLQSAAIIPGSAGASLAGFPTSVAGLTAAGGGAGGGGAAAGGGGAGGGLSGGTIAGIVVGSVAGAVLLVGVTAVVVAAVVLSKDSDSDSSPSEPTNKRASVRKTIVGMFSGPKGGVDIMNEPGKGHQSISGRSPAV